MIVNLSEIRQQKEEEARIKVEAQAKLEEMRNARGDDYNYKFFELANIFWRRYPGALTEWDKFLNDNWR